MITLLPKYIKNTYLKNNEDLINYSFNIIQKHYIFFGIRENRCEFIENAIKKINGIEGICWINLNRSMERNLYMNFILQYCNVPSYRIDAIDGENITKEYDNKNMSNYEIACVLSHLKTFYFIEKFGKGYFMICEDDISIENIQYFKNTDLKKIISDAPEFDILMICHTSSKNFKNTYTDWNDECRNNNYIAGTVCYIVNINNISNIIKIYSNKICTNKIIQIADILIYKNLKTFVYKYNFITSINADSEIHPKHISRHIYTQKKNLNFILKNKNL
jgi:GR25 family glycosyltransferase involved in LPS biosynthesis